ncbi:uncharacterized protein LOC127360501 isoform X3 [Dicentrarchus labrax]|uniref:uncharacterized protein LOC127360501 isoform X2 n=1 Tax=Dicentrarchus labrax TaxID=13489 RepID=UPI0021F624BE|nr:uncharacterized protein LOC127360501 isoform X2 [Dicentrarchus labrax]XP_051250909.1 uncharacterized protein LOC127360501 isoform X3 [Dicentrarchus labrax]
MSLKALEKGWKAALTNILEHLTDSQFSKLLFKLDKIPQGKKAGKAREQIPQIIIEYYGPEESISVINKEMMQIPRKDAAVQGPLIPFVKKLKELRQKNKATTSKSAADSGSAAKKRKLAADQPKSCKADKTDPAGPVKPKQKKTEKPNLTLKPTGSTKTSQGQSAAVQSGKMKTAAVKKASKKKESNL